MPTYLAVCAGRRRTNTIYCFETWGHQILDFIDAFIGEPAFVITNSVGGACLAALCSTLLIRATAWILPVPHVT